MEPLETLPVYPKNPKLMKQLREILIRFMMKYLYRDCFVWSTEDMTEINEQVISHKHGVDLNFPHVRPKRRKFTLDETKLSMEESNVF